MKSLLDLSSEFPGLTFQNSGYEYLNRSNLSESELSAIDEISEILKGKIEGFVKFYNFNVSKEGVMRARLDYYWNRSFRGVGYFPLKELDSEAFIQIMKDGVKIKSY